MEMNWIACAERMPPAYESCIVGRPDVPWPITAFWTGQKWCRDVMKDEFHVTHWMPMPPPPSNDGGKRVSEANPLDRFVRLRRSDWDVRTIPLAVAQDLVRKHHYSGGGSNTATYRHGLFLKGSDECYGVAWWIPPTKAAANVTYPTDWRGVLALTRLAIAPEVPKNGASFLLGASMRLIDRKRWPCLVTYADEMQGHTGAIYRATNWEYCGMTAKEATFFKDGRMVARKAGPRTRTHQEMIDMGCEMVGRFAKHKFRHLAT